MKASINTTPQLLDLDADPQRTADVQVRLGDAPRLSDGYTIRYLPPRSREGLYTSVPLRAGQPVTVRVAVSPNGLPTGAFEITGLSRLVQTVFLNQVDLKIDGPGYIYEMNTDVELPIPRSFRGVRDVFRISDSSIRVIWNTPPERPYDAFEVSVADTEADLFTDRADTKDVRNTAARSALVTTEKTGVVGVRLRKEGAYADANTEAVEIPETAAPGTGSTPSNVTPEVTIRRGDTTSLTASPDGALKWYVMPETAGSLSDDTDPTPVLTAGPRSGEVLVVSTDNPAAEPVTLPLTVDAVSAATINASWENAGDGATVYLRWGLLTDDPIDSTITYRIYWTTEEGAFDLTGQDHIHTSRPELALTDLPEGQEVRVAIVAEDQAGNTKRRDTDLLVRAVQRFQPPSVIRMRPLQSCVVAEGSPVVYDLAATHRVTAKAGEDPNDPTLWDRVTVEAIPMGGNADVSVNGKEVTVSADVDAIVGPDQTVVLLRISSPDTVTVYEAFCAGVGLSSGRTALNIGGLEASALFDGDYDVDLVSLAGENAAPTTQPTFQAELERQARRLGIDKRRIQPRENGIEPEILVFKGADGWGTICASHEAPSSDQALRPLPLLPAEIAQQATFWAEDRLSPFETEWTEQSWAEITRGGELVAEENWIRVLDGEEGSPDATLYDVFRMAAPSEVYYSAPQYFSGRWFDQNAYPDDVRSVLTEIEGGQAAIYRADLQSPASPPTPPSIRDFTVTPMESEIGIRMSWRAFNPVDPDEELTGLLIPAYVQQKNTTQTIQAATSYGGAEVTGLLPNTEYDAWLGGFAGQSQTVQTRRGIVDAEIIGQLVGKNTYEYIYNVPQPEQGEPWNHWSSPFFGNTTQTTRTLTQEGNPVTTHDLTITYDGESVSQQVDTTWVAPEISTSFEREIDVGRTRSARTGEPPVFRQLQYSGTQERDLPHNVYPAGQYRAVVTGWLAADLTGRLEDYASAVFVSPDGTELGPTVNLERSTELAVRLKVTASNGHTPFVTGARVMQL